MKRHNINLIKEVGKSLHSNKNVSNIAVFYRHILDSIKMNDENA